MELFSRMESFAWIAYLFSPLILLIKFFTISLVIYIGVFFKDMHRELTLGKIFTVVVASEAVFILASIAKLVWFIFFAGNYTLDDMSFFYPLSLANMFRRSEVDSLWVVPLQSVNLFQVIYILMLASGLSRISNTKRETTDKVVLMTYVPAILFWIVLIMFLTIDLTA